MTPTTGQDRRSATHFDLGFGSAKVVSVRLIATGNLRALYRSPGILSNSPAAELRLSRGVANRGVVGGMGLLGIIVEFLELKRRLDPHDLFSSDMFRRLFGPSTRAVRRAERREAQGITAKAPSTGRPVVSR